MSGVPRNTLTTCTFIAGFLILIEFLNVIPAKAGIH